VGRYLLSRDIEAPPADVFKAFTEPAIVADWMDGSGIRDSRSVMDPLYARRAAWRGAACGCAVTDRLLASPGDCG